MKKIFNLFSFFKNIYELIKICLKYKALNHIKNELEDYQIAFCLLIMGSLVGLPLPPTGILLRLLPFMDNELKLLINRSTNLDDCFAYTFSKFDLD